MKIHEGYVYHLNDNYFELMQGCRVKNKTIAGRTFPAYCCYIDKCKSLYWMIPMSTKIEKYQAVYKKEMDKYGRCLSVAFGEFDGKCIVFQIQEMFPAAKEHIMHPHTRKGKLIAIEHSVRDEVRRNFDKLRELTEKGIQCILSDVKQAERIIHSRNH